MSKYTKGKWEIRGNAICVDETGLVIADVRKSLITHKANARLIASAPELLEACKDFLYQIVNMKKDIRFNNQARDFINTQVDKFNDVVVKATTT